MINYILIFHKFQHSASDLDGFYEKPEITLPKGLFILEMEKMIEVRGQIHE